MYNIKKVSELLDIPSVTIRAWENRYQIISPIRSKGGHRLYSQSDIETLKWLKEQIQENNMKIGEAVRLLKQTTTYTSNNQSQGQIYNNLTNELYEGLVRLNTMEANSVIDMAFTLYNFEDVLHKIIVPVLYRIGDDWEKGVLNVAQEHFASEIILQRCTQFLRVLPINPHLPKALAFCPEGEHHHIGLMIFSLFLRKKGMEVIYLGPNTPLQDSMALIPLKQISIIVISMTIADSIHFIQSWINSCLTNYPDIKFVLGGPTIQKSPPISSPSTFYLSDENWEAWYQNTIRIKP